MRLYRGEGSAPNLVKNCRVTILSLNCVYFDTSVLFLDHVRYKSAGVLTRLQEDYLKRSTNLLLNAVLPH